MLDFSPETDKLELHFGAEGPDRTLAELATQVGPDLVLQWDAVTTLRLSNLTLAELATADVTFLG